MSPKKSFFNTCLSKLSAFKTVGFLLISFSVFIASPVSLLIKDNYHTSLIYTAFAESDGGSGGDAGAEGGMGGDGAGGNNATAYTIGISSVPTIAIASTNINGIAVYFTPPTATIYWSGIPIDYPGVTCSRASGSTFTIGTTNVSCSAYNYYTGETVSTSYSVVVTYLDQVAPVISLVGSSTVTIPQGSVYVDAGASAADNYDGDITSRITRTGAVNTSVVGSYTLTYSVKDNAANSATTRIRTVIVSDNVAPILTLLGAATTTIQVGTIYLDAGATAADGINGDISTSITATSTLNRFVPGTYTITYFVTDASGINATPVIRTIIVVDSQSPVITLTGSNPQTILVGNPYTELGATATDNVDSGLIVQSNASSVNTSVVGLYTVTYNVTDTHGNVATQVTRTIQVVDTTRPVVTLNGSSTIIVPVGNTYTELGANVLDNYAIGLLATSTGTVLANTIGSYTITYTATDLSGNAALPVTRTVQVVDTNSPVITLNGSSTQIISVGSPYTELGATVTDNYDTNLQITTSTSTVNTLVVGTYSVTYSATDSSGNVAIPVTRTISVTDIVPPVITLNGSSTIIIPVGGAYSELGANVTDNYSTGLLVTSTGTVNTTTVGTYVVTYNATDSNGNTATPVTRTVQVTDNQIPVITLNGSSTVVIQIGTAYVELGAIVTDNYDSLLTPAINASLVNTSAVGSYTVTYNATDSSGNHAATITRTVQVVDTQIPVISLNGSSTQITSVGIPYVELGATVTDNVSVGLSPVINASTVNTSVVGSYTVTYNAIDGQGNSAVQVTRLVNVVDSQVPVITLNGSSTQTISVGSIFTDLGTTVTDNYDSGLLAISSGTVNTSLVGIYSITYNVTDSSGNTAIPVTRTINVIDNQAPTITLLGSNPQIILVGTPYTELGATTTDNYDTNLIPSINSTGVNTNVTGTYSVIYSVTDSNGNNATQVSRTVTVVDTQAPIITLLGTNPQTITVGNPYLEQGSTVSDNLDVGLVASVDSSSLNINTVGTYSVTYSVTDSSGNTATTTRTINVVDITPPVITLNGSSTINLFVGDVYNELGATAFDAVSGTTTVVATGTVDTNATGTYTILYSATDVAGNVATTTRDVIVSAVVVPPSGDAVPPVITLNGSSTINLFVGDVYNELGATVTDNVDATSSATTVGNVDTSTPGNYPIIYIATDAAGNHATNVTRTVIVSNTPVVIPDIVAPVLTLNGGSSIQVLVGTIYTELGATAFDAVSGTTTVVATGTVDTNATGTYTILYTSTDTALNVGSTTRTVTVVDAIIPDTQAPTISLNGSSTINLFTGGIYAELGAIAVDTQDGTFSATSTGAVDTNNPGTYTITYGATDAAGNSATEITRTVIVSVAPALDTQAPTITLNGSSTINLFVGDVYSELGATVADNVDATSSATTVGNVDTSTQGTYPIIYIATDTAGNHATNVTRTVIVTTPIVITLSQTSAINSTINGIYFGTSTLTLAEALSFGITGTTTITNSTLASTTINNGTIINSDLTNCDIVNALVKNYLASNCSISNSVVDPPSGLNDLTGTTATSSEIFVSDVTYSNVSGSYVSTSTVTASTLTDSTSTDSEIATSTIIDSSIASSTVTTSTTTDSVIDSSVITSSNVIASTDTASTITDSQITNSTTSASIVTAANVTESTLTSSTAATSTVASSTVTSTEVTQSTITSSNTDTSAITNSTITDSVVSTSTVSNSTVNTSSVASSTIIDATASIAQITNSTVASSTLDQTTITNSTSDSSTVVASTVADSTIINSEVSTSTATGSTVTDGTVTDSSVVTSPVTNSTVDTSTVTNTPITDSTVTGSAATNSTITNSAVTNATTTDTTTTGAAITNSDISGSTVATSTIDSSTITGTTVDTSTVTGSTADESTVHNSTITDSSTNNTSVTDSSVSGSTVASSTVDTSVVATSTILDSAVTNSTSTNSTITQATSTNSTVTDGSLTSSSVATSTIDDSTVTGSNLTTSTIASSTVNSSIVASSSIATSTMSTSTVTDSIVTYSVVDTSTTTNSTLTNASTTNVTLSDSAVSDSSIASSTVASSTIDASTITNSTTTDSILTNSTTTNVTLSGSTLTGTTLTDSILTNSTTTNTTIANSTIENAILDNATVLNDIITSGTVFTNGTTTSVTATTSLADIINYAPLASFSTITNGLSASFTDTSSDRNVGTALTDSWSYFWNFGDGTTATSTSTTLGVTQSHTYSLSGLYNVILTLLDSASNSSTKSSLVQVTAPAPAQSNGASGSGSSVSVSGGGYFVTSGNQMITQPISFVVTPISFTLLPSEKKATSTVATSTKSQVKNKEVVTKKKVTVKKPVVIKKVTAVSKATERPSLWNKVVSFIKKFGFGN